MLTGLSGSRSSSDTLTIWFIKVNIGFLLRKGNFDNYGMLKG